MTPKAVLDVEFLLRPPKKLARHVIYFYRRESGALRSIVRQRVLELFSEKIQEPVEPSALDRYLSPSPFFDTLVICESSAIAGVEARKLSAIIAMIDRIEQPFFLIVPFELFSPLDHPASCYRIVEPTVESRTFGAIMKYAFAAYPYGFESLRNMRAYRKHLQSYADQNLNLKEFLQCFERLTLVCIDEGAGRFVAPAHLDLNGMNMPSFGRILERFVDSGEVGSSRDTIRYAASFLFGQHRLQSALGDKIQRQSLRLFQSTIATSCQTEAAKRRLLWFALYIAFIEDLRGDAAFHSLVDLCRSFEQCCARKESEDVLHGFWPRISRTLSSSLSSGLRERMQSVLDRYSEQEAPWALEFLRLARSATASVEKKDEIMAFQPQTPSKYKLRHFEDARGQANLSARLLSLGRNPESRILFTGAAGVGKRALARLYASWLWCEGPEEGPQPCGRCSSCQRGVDMQIAFSQFDFEEGSEKIEYFARQTDAEPFFLEFRIILLLNIQKLPSRELDALLKVMETRTKTVFLFTCETLASISVPIASRCQFFAVRPLIHDDAVALLRDACGQWGSSYEDAALDIIAQSAKGRAGTAVEKLSEINAGGQITVSRARAVLGLDWLPASVDALASLLEGDAAAAEVHLGKEAGDVLSRLQRLVAVLDLRQMGEELEAETIDPVARHQKRDWDSAVWHSLGQRSASEGQEAEKLWRSFASFWATADAYAGTSTKFLFSQATASLVCQHD